VFGDVLKNLFGGPTYIVNMNFGKAANFMFASIPGCLFHHQANFMTDFFKNEAKATPDQYGMF